MFGDFCPSVRRNPPLLNGKGHHRESMHSRYATYTYTHRRRKMLQAVGAEYRVAAREFFGHTHIAKTTPIFALSGT